MGMINTIWGSFCSFLNWEGADIWPLIRPKKIPVGKIILYTCYLVGLKIKFWHEISFTYVSTLCVSSKCSGDTFFSYVLASVHVYAGSSLLAYEISTQILCTG